MSTDELELEATDGGAADPRPRPRRRRGRRRPWGWAAVALGLVIGGASVAPAGGVLPADGTGGVPLGVTDLRVGREPIEVWRAPVEEPVDVQVVDDVVLEVGADRASALDLATGEVLWSLETQLPSCSVNVVIVCVENGTTRDAQVVRLDPRTGEQVRAAAPGVWAAVDVGDDLVVVSGVGPNPISLTRLGPDGTRRWVVSGDGATYVADAGRALMADLRVRGDRLVMDGWLTVDLRDGTLLVDGSDAWSGPDWVWEAGDDVRVDDGDQGRTSYDVRIDGEVVARDQEFRLRVDDDLGGLVDLRWLDRFDQDGVEALRTDTGESLWTADASRYPTARLDGVVLLADWMEPETATLAVDVRSGESLWDTSVGSWPLTGGDRTFVLISDDRTMSGVDARTGRARWRVEDLRAVPVPLTTGMLVVIGEDLVRLDWPG